MRYLLILLLLIIPLCAKDSGGFHVQKAEAVTYKVVVENKDNTLSYGSAVAISSKGKLITAYHVIEGYVGEIIVQHAKKRYKARVGQVSVANDLAFLYIPADNIPYAKLDTNVTLGDELYLLGGENILLKGMVSKNDPSELLIDLNTKPGMSGCGVFDAKNRLVAVLSRENILKHTSVAIKTNALQEINESYSNKPSIDYQRDAKNYDTSYCTNKDDLKVWEKLRRSKDLRIQRLHALFLGLCQKVKNRDLTTDAAQYIFEQERQKFVDE
ncbi:S1 family peptidase [Sulfurimonas paralvinellae]|uniref:Trypsin-like peptidase domain-containing protein n=1 Tax=Sulfurimonas paralvinellae TaxID=317658 RepID=A0A7M1BAQ0_9BACT|nr:serine protease [Sulfurimonas paralvinellae]QOP46773.1 trypsin-like peptidase domain-containing protein [Sulfurimonas paralvinellae]